jgi:hypothetical protein
MISGFELTPFGGLSIRIIQCLLVEVEVGVHVDVVVAFVDKEMQEMNEEEDTDWVFMWFLFFIGL